MATLRTAVDVKASEVIAMYKAGKTREEVRKHFNLSHGAMKGLMEEPALAGIQANRTQKINFIDDTVASAPATSLEGGATNTLGQEGAVTDNTGSTSEDTSL